MVSSQAPTLRQGAAMLRLPNHLHKRQTTAQVANFPGCSVLIRLFAPPRLARDQAARGGFSQRRGGAKFAKIILEDQPGLSNHDLSKEARIRSTLHPAPSASINLIRALPESAGTAPPVAGSNRIEMAPPVKKAASRGFIRCPHFVFAGNGIRSRCPSTDCNHQGEGRERDCAVAVMWKSTELMYDPI
jgi:hypothetical protein